MPIGPLNTPPTGSLDLLRRIHDAASEHGSGQVNGDRARQEVAGLIAELKAAPDVRPSQLTEARSVLVRLGVSEGGSLAKLKQVAHDASGTSATFEKVGLPQGRQAVQRLKAAAELATLPYTDRLPEGSTIDRVQTSYLSLQVDKALRDQRAAGTDSKGAIRNEGDPTGLGRFIDHKSGLVANVVVDPHNREVKVIFGGTTAGLTKSGNFMERSRGNLLTTLSQWVSNLKSALGFKAHSLHQAANLTRQVVDIVARDPELRGYTVSTIGHSKGAAEAVFAALSQDQPLQATGFSSADLGGRLVRGLPLEHLARAKELVQHFHVKADAVPNLRYLTPSMRPLGQECVIPAAGSSTSALGRHDQFAQHITAWCEAELASYDRGAQYTATPG